MRADVDTNAIPRRFAVDTSFLVIGLHSTDDDKHAICASVLALAVQARCEILIPAPAWSEYLRGGEQRQALPRPFEVVAFDRAAAHLLGVNIATDDLRAAQTNPGTTRAAIRFDAMIAACAKRHNAEALLCVDDDFARWGKLLGLACMKPEALLHPQRAFPFDGGVS